MTGACRTGGSAVYYEAQVTSATSNMARKLRRRRHIRRLLAALKPYEPERIYVFGSWARGEADDLSDLDVVVIKETPRPFLERLLTVGRMLPYDLGPIDLFVYTPGEFAEMLEIGNALAETVVTEGCLMYGQEKPP